MKRMKTVLVLLVICGVAACQSYIDFRKPMRLVYGGDTLIISLQGDSVIFSGEAAELVLRDSTLLEIIQAHGGGGGGGVTPTDNILQWDAVNNYYKPYESKQSFMSFYTGTTYPDGEDRLNLDGILHATRIIAKSTQNAAIGCITSDNMSPAINGYNSSLLESGYRNGINAGSALGSAGGFTVGVYDTDGRTASGHNLNLLRIAGGNTSFTGNFVNIVDNPYTTGTISGKILSATIGTTERINLNPRVVDDASSVAYIFDTHNNLSTSGAKLFSLKNQGVEKFFIDKDGYVSGAKYYVSALNTAPSSATDTGTTGEIRVTATHIYVCTATNTWVRTALTTW